jgi:cobalt-precorrin 5A hydrolase
LTGHGDFTTGVYGQNKIAVLAITQEGFRLGTFICKELGAELHVKEGLTVLAEDDLRIVRFSVLSDHIKSVFNKYRGLIFVMSLGIVNRVIAPLIQSKYTDPAVVTIDEVGRYVISTLSGHEGGANELTYLVSSLTGADPVVTTATESNRTIILGVGCRRGEKTEMVLEAIEKACEEVKIEPSEIRCLASAWVKRDEVAIYEAAKSLNLYTRFIPEWMIELYYKTHPQAARSEFVFSKIGVYGVAEPCAMLSGRNTELLLCRNYDGVKVAVARENLGLI